MQFYQIILNWFPLHYLLLLKGKIITLNKSLLKRQIDIQLKTTKPDIIISDNYSDLKKFKSFNFFVYKNNDNFHSKNKKQNI